MLCPVTTHNKRPITALNYSTTVTTQNDTPIHLNVIAPPTTTCRQLIHEERKNYRNLRIFVESARRKLWSFPISGTNRSETASESMTWRVSVGTIYLLLSVGRALHDVLIQIQPTSTHNREKWARTRLWRRMKCRPFTFSLLPLRTRALYETINARQKPVSQLADRWTSNKVLSSVWTEGILFIREWNGCCSRFCCCLAALHCWLSEWHGMAE